MFQRLLYKLSVIFPLFETIIRNLYWRLIPYFPSLSQSFSISVKKFAISNEPIQENLCISDNIILDFIYDKCIDESSTLLVHSNLSSFHEYGINASSFADRFISYHIKYGTLAVPTFPILRNLVNSENRLLPVSSDLDLPRFTVSSKRINTGLLGKRLLSYKNTVRSKIPINNISANGSLAPSLFVNEHLYHQSPFPCGIYSPWYELAQLSAQILFINCTAVHSCTMIHVAEDCHPEIYYQYQWYWKRFFEIERDGVLESFFTFERHPKISMSYCENKFNADLLADGILKEFKLGPINLAVLKSNELLDYLINKPLAYPYYGLWLSLL